MTETLTWPTVCQWMAKNPHKKTGLLSLRPTVPAAAGILEVEKDANGWEHLPIEPATPLAAVMTAQDAEFAAATPGSRAIDLMKELVDLQNRAVQQLKGRAWPVRKTAEGLITMSQPEPNTWTALGWDALCHLRECQIAFVNEQAKTLQFSPRLDLWNQEWQTLFLTPGAETVLVPPSNFTNHSLAEWIQEKEKAEWTIGYPIAADAPLADLQKKATELSESIHKLTKAQLQRRLGRKQSLHMLSQW